MSKIIKTKESCGADQNTPSIAEYFTWLNNTNEGSNEEQTLANLDFFAFLNRKYGMIIDIYAWDAGNLDGARTMYYDKIKDSIDKQYPNGYGPIVAKAKSIGTRMGIWGGPDGYGDTIEQENERREKLVSLCRDYNFALFKFDRACGKIRKEKRSAFCKTMLECRKYSPDLILLLHRNKVGEGMKYATTDLWQRKETYVDGNSWNIITAPHHRAFAFTRGLTPNLTRLVEDHGVCISSFNDYFEDDLITQAFGRCLILAPEIYGNPFFLRDFEYDILARIYNLHRRYRDILVNGMILPSSFGTNAVSRGDDKRRFVVTSNASWDKKRINILLDEKIGLKKTEYITVILRFPYEELLGIYKWGDSVEVDLLPFRACLIEVVDTDFALPVFGGCKFLTVHESNGLPDKIKIVASSGKIYMQIGLDKIDMKTTLKFDNTEPIPKYLGSLKRCKIPKNNRQLYERAMFDIDNDSFEAKALRHAGKTEIPEVQKCRDLFFNQQTYVYRGTESQAMFDGNDDTFFDSMMPGFIEKCRVNGGELRVDIGKIAKIERVEIDYFEPSQNIKGQSPGQKVPKVAGYSVDLQNWSKSKRTTIDIYKDNFTTKLVVERVNNTVELKGKLKKVSYYIDDKMQFFILKRPMYRIHNIKFLGKDGEVKFDNAKANNLMSDYSYKRTLSASCGTVSIPNDTIDSFVAVAINGIHGREGVYAVIEYDGKIVGACDRAPAFPINTWQHEVHKTIKNNTYYFDVTDDMKGKEIKVYTLFNKLNLGCKIDVYLCAKHKEIKGEEFTK